MYRHNKHTGDNLNSERAALLGVYHDASEIITGDLPTPIKYYNPQIIESYKAVEEMAENKLVSMLPQEYQAEYKEILSFQGQQDRELKKYVKAADKLSALVKCIEEIRMGNDEFKQAKNTIEESLIQMNIPEVDIFMEDFLPSFSLTLDEQNVN